MTRASSTLLKEELWKIDVLGTKFDNVDRVQAASLILMWLDSGRRRLTVYTPNVDYLVKSRKDRVFAQVLERADLLVADGMPVVWASRWLGTPLRSKISGSSLFIDLCSLAASKGRTVFFLGSAEGVAGQAASRLTRRFPGLNVVGTYSPYFGFEHDASENARIVGMIRAAQPDILFVGLGAPKAEKWIDRHREQLDVPVTISIGAALDFAAGVKPMPPEWIKNAGFGWLWRLASEPRRLWRRYLIEDPVFFYYVLRQMLQIRKS
jgi:N-acetylglucosaminyldiphosphoundecaprenol N-acetyl-beta-D-mannosaminyltransferase